MRKEFKNAKAKHGLNSKGWIRLIGLSFLRDQKRREEKRREEKGRRRRRGRGREEEEKRRRKEEQKGMESNIEYGLLGFLVRIHVCGLWVVRNLTLELILV